MKTNIFQILPLRLSQFLSIRRPPEHFVQDRNDFREYERERSHSDYEMYYWDISYRPWP